MVQGSERFPAAPQDGGRKSLSSPTRPCGARSRHDRVETRRAVAQTAALQQGRGRLTRPASAFLQQL